jgi:uncharacterized protein (DUF2236 family)
MLLGDVMGLFFHRKDKDQAVPPDRRAYDQVWDREIDRLGQDEVVRRMAAVNDYRSGRTGPSGFESWNTRIENEIMRLAYEIADRDNR